MHRAALLAALALSLLACDDDDLPPERVVVSVKEPTDEPAREPVAEPELPAEDAGAAPGETPSTPRVTTGTSGTAPVTGQSITSCCTALSIKAATIPEGPGRRRMAQGAQICHSIDRLVQEGKTTRTQGLRQVRAAVQGDAPAACN